jgi:hypothetical protein
MKLNKYDIPTLGKIVNESVFLNIEEDLIILYKVISSKSVGGRVSYVNESVPVAVFTVDKKEKKVILSTSCTTYEILLKCKIIDESCDEPLLNKIHDDFVSEFTKYMLVGDIDVS